MLRCEKRKMAMRECVQDYKERMKERTRERKREQERERKGQRGVIEENVRERRKLAREKIHTLKLFTWG